MSACWTIKAYVYVKFKYIPTGVGCLLFTSISMSYDHASDRVSTWSKLDEEVYFLCNVFVRFVVVYM